LAFNWKCKKWNSKIVHWNVKIVVKNLPLAGTNSYSTMNGVFKHQRDANPAGRGGKWPELVPLAGRESSTLSCVQNAAARPRCPSSPPGIGPSIAVIVIRSVDDGKT
jgi:hypothetical protein